MQLPDISGHYYLYRGLARYRGTKFLNSDKRRVAGVKTNDFMGVTLAALLFACRFAVLAKAQEPNNSPPAVRVRHSLVAQHGLTLHFTRACDQTAAHLMLGEANRLAQILKLQERTPIPETNVSVFLLPPVELIRSSQLGTLDTKDYAYYFDFKTTVTGVDYKDLDTAWEQFKREYTWPISRLDTNKALGIATEIMTAAGMDADALNRDCNVDIRPSMTEGIHGSHFLPFYYVDWYVPATNYVYSPLPGGWMANDAEWRRLPVESGKMLVAHLTFLEPTRQIGSLRVRISKYLKRKSSENLDLVKLLTPENPEDVVMLEMRAATNMAALRELYIRNGAPESLLKKYGWDTNMPP